MSEDTQKHGGEGHNSQATAEGRTEVIRECASDWAAIEVARKELNEKAAEMRERLKESGVNKASFFETIKLVKMKDNSARDDFMGGVHECYAVLGPGQTLDWVDIQERQKAEASVVMVGDEEGEKEEEAA